MESKVAILGVILVILSAFDLTYCQQCSPGQTDLNSYVNTSTGSGGYTLTGYATVCVGGNFVPICNRSSLGFFEASSVCLSVGVLGGYYGPSSVSLSPIDIMNTNRAARNFNCTDLYGSCTWNAPPMAGGTCPNGNAILTCQNICSEDSVVLFNNYTTTVSGTTVTVGIPQYCSSGTYSRFCNDGTNSANIGRFLCNSAGFLFGRTLSFNASLYAGSPQGIIYASNFTCDNTGSCNTPNYTTNPQCYSGQRDLVVQCNNGRSCQGLGPFFYTNVTTVSNGFELVTGIVLNCWNGTTSALCNRNLRPRSLNIICRQLGFIGNGTLVSSNPTLYGRTPQGVFFYSNVTCPPGVTDINNCAGDPALQCPTQLRNVVIQCSRPAASTGTATRSVLPTRSITRSISATVPPTVATTTTSVPTVTPATSDSNVGVIVGVSVGLVVPLVIGVVIIIIILLIVFLVIRRADYKKQAKDPIRLKAVS